MEVSEGVECHQGADEKGREEMNSSEASQSKDKKEKVEERVKLIKYTKLDLSAAESETRTDKEGPTSESKQSQSQSESKMADNKGKRPAKKVKKLSAEEQAMVASMCRDLSKYREAEEEDAAETAWTDVTASEGKQRGKKQSSKKDKVGKENSQKKKKYFLEEELENGGQFQYVDCASQGPEPSKESKPSTQDSRPVKSSKPGSETKGGKKAKSKGNVGSYTKLQMSLTGGQSNRREPQPLPEELEEDGEVVVRLKPTELQCIAGAGGRQGSGKIPTPGIREQITWQTGVQVLLPQPGSQSLDVVLWGHRLHLGTAVSLLYSMIQQKQAEEYQYEGAGQKSTDFQRNRSADQEVQGYSKGHGKGQRDLRRDSWRAEDSQEKGSGQEVKNQKRAAETAKGARQKTPNARKGGVTEDQRQGEMAGQQLDYGRSPGRQSPYGRGPGQEKKGRRKSQSGTQDKFFEEYMSDEAVKAGLEQGTLIEGCIRINQKNFEEAFINHPDGNVFMFGVSARNRALNGDVVAIQLDDRSHWLVNNDTLKELGEASAEKGDNSVVAGDDDSEAMDPDVIIESVETIVIANDGSSDVISQDTAGVAACTSGVENLSIQTDRNSSAAVTRSDQPSTPVSKKGENSKQERKSPNRKTVYDRFTKLGEVLAGGNGEVGKMLTDTSGDKHLQRTGKVVAIIEKKHSRVCTGQLTIKQDRKTTWHFSPKDSRVPRLMIPKEDLPNNFLKRPYDYAKTLFVARIADWSLDGPFAQGRLVESLGEVGAIEPETTGHLLDYDIDFSEFPAEALKCLPQELPWQIPGEELTSRRDFRSQCVFTIDPSTARDLDDALSVESLGDGMYEVGVHIADVSYFLKEKTVLDGIAGKRATSVYLVHKVIPMLPRLLCEQLCSLNPNEDRLTFSVVWKISETGEVEEEWFGRTVIRSCVKLSYDHAQGFIEQPDKEWTEEELPPLSAGFTVEDIKSRTLILDKIAKNLRGERFRNGALSLNQVKLQYNLDKETGLPNGYSVYKQRDSNRLVEEFMLLANMAVAHRLNSHYPDKALLRRHPPPQDNMIEALKVQCEALGITMETDSALDFQNSLNQLAGDDEYSQARMEVLVQMCSKPMQMALYFCTGCLADEYLYRHYALNVPLYTHFTSPIRRYADVMVHRLLGASLGYSEDPQQTSNEIQRQAEQCNDKKAAAKRVGELSSDLFFSVFVQVAGPLEEQGMVMAVYDKSFDVVLLKLGVIKRVYLNILPLKEKLYRKEGRGLVSLTLVWEKDEEEGEEEVQQVLRIFTQVQCTLQPGDQPLLWRAVLKRPVAESDTSEDQSSG